MGRPREGGRRSHVSLPCFTQGTRQTHEYRCRRWRRRACAAAAAAARQTAPILPMSRARRPATSTAAQQTSRAGGWSRADMQAHSSMAEAADVELACLQRRRPLWQARDQRRRVSCGGRWRERDECGIGGGVNCADARSLASTWRGASRQTVMSGPRGMACWGTELGTENLCGCAAVALLALLTRRFGAE